MHDLDAALLQEPLLETLRLFSGPAHLERVQLVESQVPEAMLNSDCACEVGGGASVSGRVVSEKERHAVLRAGGGEGARATPVAVDLLVEDQRIEDALRLERVEAVAASFAIEDGEVEAGVERRSRRTCSLQFSQGRGELADAACCRNAFGSDSGGGEAVHRGRLGGHGHARVDCPRRRSL